MNKQAVHFDVAIIRERLTSKLLVNCDGTLGSVQNPCCSSHFIKHIHDGPCHLFSFPSTSPLLLPMFTAAVFDAIVFELPFFASILTASIEGQLDVPQRSGL